MISQYFVYPTVGSQYMPIMIEAEVGSMDIFWLGDELVDPTTQSHQAFKQGFEYEVCG